ncbi:MAG: acyl-CoA synthetase [Chromatiales bacterium]|jgi:acetyl-CoA synthetase|nr:acyl-CoA synthetase [Chromatiales bacterium]
MATPLTDFTRYSDAMSEFSKERLWSLFDGDRESLNVTHECVDRHRDKGEAVRIAHADGRDEVISFADLSDQSSRIANWLVRTGITKGDRVAIMLEPSLAFYATLFGAMKSGAVAVPLFTLFGPEGLRQRVADCEPSVLVVANNKLEMAKATDTPTVLTGEQLLHQASDADAHFAPTTSADDMALFQYTSGTTREMPEAVKHRHRTVVTVAVAALYATGVRPTDRFMCPSSPAWGHGLAHGTLGPLGLGASIASYAGPFDAARLLKAIADYRINNLSAAATHYRMMRGSGLADNFNYAIEKLSFTGEPLDKTTAQWAKEQFGAPACSIYGTTEVGVILAQYPGAEDFPKKLGSLGMPVPGLNVQVHDSDGEPTAPDVIGELTVERRSGWFPTKDFGHRDADGHFYHDGRADDVIISAGWTISAREVEEALLAHPQVAEAAAIGAADELRGQVVKAFVVNAPGQDAEDATVLRDFVKAHLSAHASPRLIEFVKVLPKTPAGKINRRALRKQESSK